MNLVWSEQAEFDLIEIDEYIAMNWGISVLEKFYDELEGCLETILTRHVVHQKFEDTNCYKVLLKRHYYIIYNIDREFVQIVHIMNNHKNPDENYQKATGKKI